MGIAFMAAIASGWMTGKPAGIVGILVGLIIGLSAGVGTVCGMYLAGRRFEKWLARKALPMKTEIAASLFVDIAGLAWCIFIIWIVQCITRFLIHYVAA
jgi:hypothetical protein